MNMEQLLRKCGFSKRYRGFLALQECVCIVLENEDALLYMTAIYNEVGSKNHISWNCVERNIRTLVNSSWENGGKEQLELLAGGVLYEKPTVGEVIEILACYIKEHPEAVAINT